MPAQLSSKSCRVHHRIIALGRCSGDPEEGFIMTEESYMQSMILKRFQGVGVVMWGRIKKQKKEQGRKKKPEEGDVSSSQEKSLDQKYNETEDLTN